MYQKNTQLNIGASIPSLMDTLQFRCDGVASIEVKTLV